MEIISTTRTDDATDAHKQARAMTDMAGNALAQPGYVLLGSVSCYFFINRFNQDAQMITLPMLKGVPENLAIEGAKEVTKVMMKEYGHKEPRKRK